MQISPQPNEQCWKDTITVYPSEVVTIRVRFAQQDGTSFPFDATAGPGYVWHCHLLEHEDNEMMRPYKITQQTSIILPVGVSLVAAAAAASAIGYSYQRKRKKKQQTSTISSNQLDDLEKQSKIQRPEEIMREKENY